MVYVDSSYLNYTATLCGQVKDESYEIAGVRPGGGKLDLLDVGCGVGIDTLKVAQMVAPGSRVVGVDFDPGMAEEANRRAKERGLPNAQHFVGNVEELSFDSEFDVVRAERLFQHLRNPARALAGMVKAARPGGKVLVVDTDWSTLRCVAFDAEDNAAVASAYFGTLTFAANANRMKGLFLEAGLQDVETKTIGIVLTRDDYQRASKMSDLMTRVFDEVTCRRLQNKLDAAHGTDERFGVLDVFLVWGTVAK